MQSKEKWSRGGGDGGGGGVTGGRRGARAHAPPWDPYLKSKKKSTGQLRASARAPPARGVLAGLTRETRSPGAASPSFAGAAMFG